MSLAGLGLIGAGIFIFIYCTAWIVTPFLKETHPINSYFLDIRVLTYGPLFLLFIALSGLIAFLFKSNSAGKKKQ